MNSTNGMAVISQIMNEVANYDANWRDWDNAWDEGPWDKESWSDDWGDSH